MPLTCIFTGDDIAGSYWERISSGPIPDNNNMSILTSLSIEKTMLKTTINGARPLYSGYYRCVVYSQWGVAQSRNVQVTITSKNKTYWCSK